VSAAAPAFKPASYAALWFCYFGALGVYNPYAPLWLQSLGFSTLAIGAFASMQSWTRVLAPYAWGWLADHGHGPVRLLRTSAALSLLGCVALLLAQGQGTWALAAAVALLFLANGGISPLGEAVVIKHLHDGDGLDAKRYARIRVWGSIGFIASVVGAGFALQVVDISALPWLTLGAFLSLMLVVGRLAPEAAVAHSERIRMPVLPTLRRPEVAWFFGGTMLTVLAHTGQYAFFSLYLKELGYSKGAIGLMWAASVLAEIAFFVMAGRWFAKVSDVRWLQWAALASALRFALTAGAGSVAVLLIALQTLHALTFGAHHMACTSALGRYFPGALRTRASALYSTLGYGVPGVLGGLAGGALSDTFGLAGVFWGSAVAAILALGCYMLCARAERVEAAAPVSVNP
jgi:MFS transporter, PPP family, 3-phenylpropionic acid transporter